MAKKKIKKTFVVEIGKERYLTALMNELGFEEIERVASGGMMSAAILIMTFEGDEESYRENDYIKIERTSEWGLDTYYSLRFLDGFSADSLEAFREEYDKTQLSDLVIDRFE